MKYKKVNGYSGIGWILRYSGGGEYLFAFKLFCQMERSVPLDRKIKCKKVTWDGGGDNN